MNLQEQKNIYLNSGVRMNPELENQIKSNSLDLAKNPAFPKTDASGNQINFLELIAYKRFNDVVSLVKRYNPQINPASIGEVSSVLMGAVRTITNAEQPHIPKLEKLAVDVVVNEMEIPDGAFLYDAKIVPVGSISGEGFILEGKEQNQQEVQSQFGEQAEVENMTASELFEMEKHKRRFINMLIQGASKKGHYMFQLVAGELNEINPQMTNEYGKMMSANDIIYWLFPDETIKQMASQPSNMAGKEEIEDETDPPTLKVRGINFPVVVHELVKAIMDVFGTQGLPDDPKSSQMIIDSVDSLENETMDLRVGVPVWELFSSSYPAMVFEEGNRHIQHYLFARFCALEINEFFRVARLILSQSQEGSKYMQRMANEIVKDLQNQDYNTQFGDDTGYSLDDILGYANGGSVDNEIEVVVVAKELEKDGGNLLKFRYLSSFDNEKDAIKYVKEMWLDEYDNSDLHIVEVLTADDYKQKYMQNKYDNGGNVIFQVGDSVNKMMKYDTLVHYVTSNLDKGEKEYLGINAFSKEDAEKKAKIMFNQEDADRYDATIEYVSVWERGEAYKKGGSVEKGYNVFNYTDNVYASDEVFKTKKLANNFIKEFRNRFSNQGYYRDNQMNKIAIEDIDLLAIPSDFNPFKKFTKGGFAYVDLFEDYENIPANVQAILNDYELEDSDYNTLNDLQDELAEVGYTFEFGLDAEPFALRPIGVEVNELQGYEDYEKGNFKSGGEANFDIYDYDKKMALINLGEIYEYAIKIDKMIDEDTDLEEWVKMKLTRIEQSISDVKHSLAGWEKYKSGGEISKKQLLHIAKYSKDLIKMIQGGSRLMSWQEDKLAISSASIDDIYHHLDYKMGNRAEDFDIENEEGILYRRGGMTKNQLISKIKKEMLDYGFDLTDEQISDYIQIKNLQMFETNEREEYLDFIAKNITGMSFPSYGDTTSYKQNFYQKLRKNAKNKGYNFSGETFGRGGRTSKKVIKVRARGGYSLEDFSPLFEYYDQVVSYKKVGKLELQQIVGKKDVENEFEFKTEKDRDYWYDILTNEQEKYFTVQNKKKYVKYILENHDPYRELIDDELQRTPRERFINKLDVDINDNYAGGGEIEDWMQSALYQLQAEEDNDNLQISFVKNNEFTCQDDDANEYRVFKNEDVAEEMAVEEVREDLEYQPEMFNRDFLMDFVDVDDFLVLDIENANYDYVKDIEDESNDKYANRLIAELVDNGLISENEALTIDPTDLSDDYSQDYINLLTSEQIGDDNGVEYFIDNFGEDEFFKIVIDNNLIDFDNASKDAVNMDGIAHFLARYDGETIYLDNNVVAYRTN